MRARVIFYDERTGEILDEYDKAIFVGHKPKVDRGFVKVFVAFFRDVLANERLGKGAWRLLLYVVENLDYDSLEVHLVPKRVAAELGIDERSYYRWIKVLLEEGYLEKLAINVYRLKPYMAVKGQMSKALETEPDF